MAETQLQSPDRGSANGAAAISAPAAHVFVLDGWDTARPSAGGGDSRAVAVPCIELATNHPAATEGGA